jgi:hypothetical protein
MKTLKEDSGHFCEQCLALTGEEVPAAKMVESIVDRGHKIPMCVECYENWCDDVEAFMEELDEDDDY